MAQETKNVEAANDAAEQAQTQPTEPPPPAESADQTTPAADSQPEDIVNDVDQTLDDLDQQLQALDQQVGQSSDPDAPAEKDTPPQQDASAEQDSPQDVDGMFAALADEIGADDVTDVPPPDPDQPITATFDLDDIADDAVTQEELDQALAQAQAVNSAQDDDTSADAQPALDDADQLLAAVSARDEQPEPASDAVEPETDTAPADAPTAVETDGATPDKSIPDESADDAAPATDTQTAEDAPATEEAEPAETADDAAPADDTTSAPGPAPEQSENPPQHSDSPAEPTQADTQTQPEPTAGPFACLALPQRLLIKTCEISNKPFAFVPDTAKDTIGLVALVTTLVCFIAAIVLLLI